MPALRDALVVNNGNTAGMTFTVPPGTLTGDFLLMYVDWSSPAGESITSPPAGWTPVTATGVSGGAIANGANSAAVFFRIATASGAGSAGSTTSLSFSGVTKAEGGILAYSSPAADVASTLAGVAVALETALTAAHVTPLATMSQSCHLVQIVSDRGATPTTAWTSNAGETKEVDGYYPSTSAAPSFMVTGKDVGSGQRGGNTETANQSDQKAIMWTIGLAGASAPAASQVSYPLSDASTDASITQTGGTAGLLASAIDEDPVDTTDFIEFTNPNGTIYYSALMQALTLPLSSVRIEVVVRTPNASTSTRVYSLRQTSAATLIASFTANGVSQTNWITDSYDLSPAEIAAITVPNDLRLRMAMAAS